MNPEKREEWEAMLVAPLPGRERKPSQAEIELDGAAFMTAMNAQGG